MYRWIRRSCPVLLLVTVPLLVFGVGRLGIPHGEKCWSPNHEYFMEMRESWLSKVFFSRDREEGWIFVYDKHGRLYHRYDGPLSKLGGPWWLGKKILIMNKPEAMLELPTDAGDSRLKGVCF